MPGSCCCASPTTCGWRADLRPRGKALPTTWGCPASLQVLACARDRLLADLTATPNLTKLARACGTNRTSLQRLFQAHLGVSVMSYLREQRLQRARLLLSLGRTASIPSPPPLATRAARAWPAPSGDASAWRGSSGANRHHSNELTLDGTVAARLRKVAARTSFARQAFCNFSFTAPRSSRWPRRPHWRNSR